MTSRSQRDQSVIGGTTLKEKEKLGKDGNMQLSFEISRVGQWTDFVLSALSQTSFHFDFFSFNRRAVF